MVSINNEYSCSTISDAIRKALDSTSYPSEGTVRSRANNLGYLMEVPIKHKKTLQVVSDGNIKHLVEDFDLPLRIEDVLNILRG